MNGYMFGDSLIQFGMFWPRQASHYVFLKFLEWHYQKSTRVSMTSFSGLPSVTEAITDHFSYFLLTVCNPSRGTLLPNGKTKGISVKIGNGSFTSIPDASLSIRPRDTFTPSLTVIVIEDNAIGAGNGRCQIPGEMVATAFRNYNIQAVPQTIFAIRIVRTKVTCYRADFPVDYLRSATAGAPEGDITIFRIGGTDEQNSLGLSLEYPGENRRRALIWICSMGASAKVIADSWAAGSVPSITSDRLSKLEL